MKRMLIIIVVSIMVFSFVLAFATSCKTEIAESTVSEITSAEALSVETTASSVETGEKIKIGFTILCTDGFYIRKYIERFEEQVKNHGYDYVMLDCTFDTAKQVSQIDNLIAQKVDVMFVMPNDPKALIPGIKKAKEAGIPVLIVHDTIDPSGMQYAIGYAGASTELLGQQAAKLMNEALNNKGNIVVLGASWGANYGGLGIYEKGFKPTLSPEINILAEGDMGWDRAKSMGLMEDFLTKYDNIDGAFVFDDNTALGAIDAIKAAQREGIKVVSINGQKEAFDAIKAGDLYGTVKMDPVANVDKAFESLDLYLSGKEVPQYNYSESPIVTKENVDSIEPCF